MSDPLEFVAVHWRPPGFPGPLIEGLSFTVPAGGAVLLTGPVGSGTSAALDLAIGAQPPDDGRVLLHGIEPHELDDDRLSELRSRVGIVPAHGALQSNLSLADNIALPLLWHRRLAGDGHEAVTRVCGLLGIANLPRIRPAQAPPDLRILVAIGRALVLEPDLLLLDDPCHGLPPSMGHAIWARLQRVREHRGIAIVATGETTPDALVGATTISLPPRMQATGLRRIEGR
jgi:ABC-type transporter Mla maintaining outer membrane lipid asymmetry ATPase subunit MlaF